MTPSASEAVFARRTVIATAIVLAMLIALAVFYFAASAFFMVFAAMVLAAIFDGAARAAMMLGLGRAASLALVFLATLAALAGLIFWGGATLADQARDLLDAVSGQATSVLEWAQSQGFPVSAEEIEPSEIRDMLPDASGVLSGATTALFSIAGGIGNFFIILFLAAFIAWSPGIYRRGTVSLVPKAKRARLGQAMNESAQSLRMWLLGQAISMATVFTVSWIGLWLIDMPFAFLLALQAGLLAFVPTLGAIAAGVPIVLTGLSVDTTTALLGVGVYILIQGVESNVTTPIAQKWATSLPPALTLTVQLIFGLLFGLAGFILAVPVVAVIKTMVTMLYVEDVLGGGEPEPSDGA